MMAGVLFMLAAAVAAAGLVLWKIKVSEGVWGVRKGAVRRRSSGQ